jgi:hypothetical protein
MSPIIFVFLFILILLLFKYYWKLQIIYNSSILSFRTPTPIFPISKEKEKQYYEDVKLGKVISKNKRIVICSLLRDASYKLDKIKEKAEKVGELFGDYRILIVENDSEDDTRIKLLEWSKKNPKVEILGCGGVNKTECFMKSDPTVGHSVTFKRIKKMAILRNIYLEHVYNSYSDFDFIIVWDMDIIGNVYLDGILHSIYEFQDPDINAICANGVYRWGPLNIFYDTYALLRKNQKFHISTKLLHDIKEGLTFNYSRDKDLVEVDSCFSGFTIYNLKKISKLQVYHTIPQEDDDNLYCEHVTLNKKIGNGCFVNPKMIYILLLNE